MQHRENPHGCAGNLTNAGSEPLARSSGCPTTNVLGARHLLHAPAQDPHILFHDGLYHYCESSPHGIFIRTARHFLDIGTAEARRVWAPPGRGPCSRNLWAPELHRIGNQFHIYFAADDGKNANHRMWVLTATTSDPAGKYELAGSLDTQGWAIDGTVLTDMFGNATFVWSGWPNGRNGSQNLYMARMKSPLELNGPRILLAQPDQPWECRGLSICEGPQILQRAGRTFIVYSASGSWTQNYCLGLLVHEGGDLLDPKSWRKAGPVFQKNDHACGVGHCCFVTSPDGSTDWLIYHAKTSRRRGWSDREVRGQPFTWTADGLPFFDSPQPVGRTAVPVVPVSVAVPLVA